MLRDHDPDPRDPRYRPDRGISDHLRVDAEGFHGFTGIQDGPSGFHGYEEGVDDEAHLYASIGKEAGAWGAEDAPLQQEGGHVGHLKAVNHVW